MTDPSQDKVIDLDKAREKRDREEEKRLEQLVIERWTGKEEEK